MTSRSPENPRLGCSMGFAVLLLSSMLLGVTATRAHAADSPAAIADMIGRLRLQEAPAPVHERKAWRVPQKIVVLAFRRPQSGQGSGSSIPEAEWRTFGAMIPQ